MWRPPSATPDLIIRSGCTGPHPCSHSQAELLPVIFVAAGPRLRSSKQPCARGRILRAAFTEAPHRHRGGVTVGNGSTCDDFGLPEQWLMKCRRSDLAIISGVPSH